MSDSLVQKPEAYPHPIRDLVRARTPILNALSEGVVIADETGRIIYINPAAERMHGVNLAEVGPDEYSRHYGLFTMDGETYPSTELPLVRAVLHDETVENARWKIRRAGGSEVDAIGTAQPLYLDGEKIGSILTVHDDTARHAAELALKESEARFRNLADSSPMMVWVTEPDGSCSFLSQSWYKFTGQTEKERLGFGWLEAVHPDDQDWSRDVFVAANERHESFRLEYRLRRADGDYRWAIDAAQARFGSNGEFKGYVGSVVDIHERKSEEIRRAALVELGDRIRDLDDPADIAFAAAEILGRTLDVSRAGYGTIDPEAETITIQRDWNAPGIKSLAGVLKFRDYGSYIEDLKRGKTVVFADADKDPRTAATAGALKAISAQAVVNMPVTEQGGVVALLYLNHATTREWASEELDFVREVAERTRTAVERRRAEQEVTARSQEFYTLADNIAALAWMAYANGDIFWYNKRWYEYTGTTAATQKGWGWQSVHDPEWLPKVTARWQQSLKTGRPFEMTFPLRGWDGVFRPFLTRVVPIRDETGAIVRWFGTNVDVSDQVSVERALQEETRTLETLNRTATAIVGELDLEKAVQLVTDAAVELTGAEFGAFFYNVADEKGESYMLFTLSGAERSQFEGFGMPRATAVFHPTFAGEGIVRSGDITRDQRYGLNEPHFGLPKGHMPVVSYLAVPVIGRTGEVIGALFFGHSGKDRFTDRHERLVSGIAGQAAVAIDNARLYRDAQREIENRMKAEQAARMLNETLENRVAEEVERRTKSEEAFAQLQKMETIGQLSGGIAHDFNNLLQVIHGNLSLIQQALDDSDPRLSRWTNNALAGAERAAALTQRLLAFSRRQPLAPRGVDTNRLIESMSELLIRTLGETIEIRSDLEAGGWIAEVDPNQLENAILNLAVNARDAMPNGGAMTIETRNFMVDGAYASRNPGFDEGEYVLICVKDEGCGMDTETLERAIEPFFTTKEVGKGTGLGLSMVYGFAQQSGGQFRIESTVGEGTCAKIFLPRFAGPAGAVHHDRERGEIMSGKGETILLCEDDAEVRQFSAETLRSLGYEIIEASNANEALAILRDAGAIDLLFTDIVLPGAMNGAELAAEARKVRPNLRILYTSGYARTALDRDGRLDPGIDLLSKPFDMPDLSARLRELLDG